MQKFLKSRFRGHTISLQPIVTGQPYWRRENRFLLLIGDVKIVDRERNDDLHLSP